MIQKKDLLIQQNTNTLSTSNFIHCHQFNAFSLLKKFFPFILITFFNVFILIINIVIVSFLPDGINMVIAVGLVTPFLILFINPVTINGVSLGTIKKNNNIEHKSVINNENNTIDLAQIKSSFLAGVFYSFIMVGLYIASTYGYMNYQLPPYDPSNSAINALGLGASQAAAFSYIFVTGPVIIFYVIKSWALKLLISFNKIKLVVVTIAVQIILSIGLSVILALVPPLGVLGAGLGLLISEIITSLFVFCYLLTIVGIKSFFIKMRFTNVFKSVLGTWKFSIPFMIIPFVKCAALIVIGVYFLQTPIVQGLVDHQVLISIIIGLNFVNLSLFFPRGIGHGLINMFADKRMCLNDFFVHKSELVKSVLKLWWMSFIITALIFALYPAFTYCIVLNSSPDPNTISVMSSDVHLIFNKSNEHQILIAFINNVNFKLIPVYFLLVSFIVGHNTALIYGPLLNLVLGKNKLLYWIVAGHGMTFALLFTIGLTAFGYWSFGLHDHSIFPLMIPFALHGIYLVTVTTILWKKSIKDLIKKNKSKNIISCENCLKINNEKNTFKNLSTIL